MIVTETSGICPAGSAYVSDKSSWNQRDQPPDWKRGDCPAGRNYGDGGKDRKPCLYKPESAYLLRAAAGTVKEIKQETKDLPESGHILRQGKLPMMDEEQRRLCWKGLKYGFDTYDIAQIEENIKILSEHELPPEEKERLPVVREAYENLDYEIGSKACMF